MSADNSWIAFFEEHASSYDENIFTKNTVSEVDVLLEELQVESGARILDIGCGTGRHSVELAKRGYRMTGLDISAAMLARARDSARDAGVEVEWMQGDAARFSVAAPFDAAICLCEGAFGLLSAGDDAIAQPLAILRNISRSLREHGKALFTVLNGYHMIRSQAQHDVAQHRFDPLTLTTVSEHTLSGTRLPISVRERAFVPTELNLLFRLAGLHVCHMWGGTAGNWGRRPIDLDEMEIMIVARKAAEPAAPLIE